jgi:DNA-binding response OmpR family regulator
MSEYQILLVDDDEIHSDMLSKRIQKRGFTVARVSSGKEALDFLKNNKTEIILLDILMPDMTGLEVLKEIRSVNTQVDLSIIMVTAKSEVNDIVEALKLGANDFIQKPVNIEIAIARINTQLIALKSHKEEVVRNELEALNAMIATYNHEINNPLTVAFGFLWKLKKENKPEHIAQIEVALDRIFQIVKKIDKLASTKREREVYAQDEKIFKIE